MRVFKVTPVIEKFVNQFADGDVLPGTGGMGGFSNLSNSDLSKSDQGREGFQHTGLYCESVWHMYRYGTLKHLRALKIKKKAHWASTGQGDGGEDDSGSIGGEFRLLDIKGTHVSDIAQVIRLNLIIPPNEFHQKMIYVAGFAVGPNKTDRSKVTEVVLAGWCLSEDVKEKWWNDNKKWAVKVPKLNDIDTLKLETA